jgi:hypothetical protein
MVIKVSVSIFYSCKKFRHRLYCGSAFAVRCNNTVFVHQKMGSLAILTNYTTF